MNNTEAVLKVLAETVRERKKLVVEVEAFDRLFQDDPDAPTFAGIPLTDLPKDLEAMVSRLLFADTGPLQDAILNAQAAEVASLRQKSPAERLESWLYYEGLICSDKSAGRYVLTLAPSIKAQMQRLVKLAESDSPSC